MLSAATIEAAWAGSASIVSILTPRGVQQPFILIKPDHAIASVRRQRCSEIEQSAAARRG
jgi:ribosome-binding ATPase YchF (GTP1/OBG family)